MSQAPVSMATFSRQMNIKFGIKDAQNYISETLSAIYGHPVIDIFKMDKWLHEMVGQYEERDMSMRMALDEAFGKGTADFVESMMK